MRSTWQKSVRKWKSTWLKKKVWGKKPAFASSPPIIRLFLFIPIFLSNLNFDKAFLNWTTLWQCEFRIEYLIICSLLWICLKRARFTFPISPFPPFLFGICFLFFGLFLPFPIVLISLFKFLLFPPPQFNFLLPRFLFLIFPLFFPFFLLYFPLFPCRVLFLCPFHFCSCLFERPFFVRQTLFDFVLFLLFPFFWFLCHWVSPEL